MTVYSRPGNTDAVMSFESRYDNFIGGQWVPPVAGRYFENRSPSREKCSARSPAQTNPT